MPLTSYREPGVYLEQKTLRGVTPSTMDLVPCVVGEGRQYVDFNLVPITVADANDITLGSTRVTSINKVTKVAVDGTKTDMASPTEYVLTGNKLHWEATKAPAPGTQILVNYTARPEDSEFEAAWVPDFATLDALFADNGAATHMMRRDKDASTIEIVINPLYTGAYLALESGAPGVWVIPVFPVTNINDETTPYNVVDSTDFPKTLDSQAKFIECYQMVPMTTDSVAVGAFKTHVNAMSSVEERKERVVFAGYTTTAQDKVKAVQDYCQGYNDKRVRVVYPDKATKVLGDGAVHELGAEYLAAAVAGLDASLPVYRSLTRQKLMNFIELKNTKFTRADKNKMAGYGAMLLEQPGGANTSIQIRHQVTTAVDVISDRENSVVKVADFVSKSMRISLEPYIGVHNIDAHLLTKVTGTINVALGNFVRSMVINDGQLLALAQDENEPDTLVCQISIKPPYPCNYINITLFID